MLPLVIDAGLDPCLELALDPALEPALDERCEGNPCTPADLPSLSEPLADSISIKSDRFLGLCLSSKKNLLNNKTG